MERGLPSGELAAGGPPRRLTVAGSDLLLVRLAGGRVVAFTASCPHQRTDLDGATFVDGWVRCPLHLYEYDLETGENVVPTRQLGPGELRKAAPGYLRVHPVEERDGWIWVSEEPRPPPPSWRPPVAGPPPAAPDGVVSVARGATFELRLPTAPQPGFVWRVDTDGSVLAVVGQRSEGGEHLVRLAAGAPGRATVRCTYARPWDRQAAEIRTYEVCVYS
ncbi:MAG TPA: Rieske 2Fe-2S domain-containing protein [Acidimicrobiales bacterium]|nr:Rieske 2Fe-2S domain-containing protein [Acidimicrobiales bacterium]